MTHDEPGTPAAEGFGLSGLARALRDQLSTDDDAPEIPVVPVDVVALPDGPTDGAPRTVRSDRTPSAHARSVVARLFTAAGWPDVAPHQQPAGADPGSQAQVALPAILMLPDGRTVEMPVGSRLGFGRDDEEGQVGLGRAEVSRRHLRIDHLPEGLVATDVGSSNGTRLRRGGTSYQLEAGSAVLLESGDQLVVADGVDLCTVARTAGNGSAAAS
jgi:hypothetical protein